MESVAKIKILKEAVCIWFHTNALGKGMNPAMGK